MTALSPPTLNAAWKTRVHQALVAQVRDEWDTAVRTQKETAAGATHEEARAENDKDTRGLEQSYLARGLAKRVVELTAQKKALEHALRPPLGADAPIGPGTLVRVLDEHDVASLYFITNATGGLRVEVDAVTVRLVSTETPVGRALVGTRVGDELEVNVAGTKRSLEVDAAV